MAGSPSACALDTSTMLDLYVGGVLRDAAGLPLVLMAPDFVIAEEFRDPPGGRLVEAGIVTPQVLTPDEMDRASGLHREHPRALSYNDCAYLVLAEQRGLLLLTSERRLRAVAEERGIPVRGTLWVMDEMVRLKLLTRARAADAMRAMLDQGRRLPEDECRRRIERWRRK